MNDADATTYLIGWLRNPRTSDYSSYGYGVYLPQVIYAYIKETTGKERKESEAARQAKDLSPAFYAAAWELCRRGILRPGIKRMGAQATDDGGSGNGYSITPFGERWLAESHEDDYVPTEPGRFAEMLKPYQSRYGAGFQERAQQAVRCYGAHCYLACCAMCGAAAESVLLATAGAKNGEEEVFKVYRTSSGRSKVENMVVGQARGDLDREFRAATTLLKYWRDEAAHGRVSNIGDNEAYTSLAMLLRFAKLVDDHWSELTDKNA